jgi:hypothetical protein
MTNATRSEVSPIVRIRVDHVVRFRPRREMDLFEGEKEEDEEKK